MPEDATPRAQTTSHETSECPLLDISEIEARYESEWILVENPDLNGALEVERGTVRFHSQDRDEVYRKAVELRPRRFAMLYTGGIPEGSAVVI